MEHTLWYIGLDIHKTTSTYCVMDKEGAIVERKTIKTAVAPFTELAQKYQNASVVLEPVTESWYYADLLEDLQMKVILAHPRHVKALGHVKAKTDKNDAEMLAHLLRSNLLPQAHRTSRKVKEFKSLIRMRYQLVTMRTRCRNQVHALVRKEGCSEPYADMFGPRGIAWYRQQPLSTTVQVGMQIQLDMIETINQHIKTIEDTLVSLVGDTESFRVLTSVPDIGLVCAITIMAEIDTIERFKSYRSFVKYAGLAPGVHESAGKKKGGKLARANPYLRYIFIQITHHQKTRKNGGFKAYFEKQKESRDAKTATVITARKIAMVIYSMLRTNTCFKQEGTHISLRDDSDSVS